MWVLKYFEVCILFSNSAVKVCFVSDLNESNYVLGLQYSSCIGPTCIKVKLFSISIIKLSTLFPSCSCLKKQCKPLMFLVYCPNGSNRCY